MEKNRYIGEYPVIGIRPIIDGAAARCSCARVWKIRS